MSFRLERWRDWIDAYARGTAASLRLSLDRLRGPDACWGTRTLARLDDFAVRGKPATRRRPQNQRGESIAWLEIRANPGNYGLVAAELGLQRRDPRRQRLVLRRAPCAAISLTASNSSRETTSMPASRRSNWASHDGFDFAPRALGEAGGVGDQARQIVEQAAAGLRHGETPRKRPRLAMWRGRSRAAQAAAPLSQLRRSAAP